MMQAGFVTDKGGRGWNEDYAGFSLEDGLFLVCDGVGGESGGAQASRLAVDSVIKAMKHLKNADTGGDYAVAELPLEARKFLFAVSLANLRVFWRAQKSVSLHGMATTLAALLFSDGYVYCLSVGDSGIYLYRNGVLRKINIPQKTGMAVKEVVGQRENIEADLYVGPVMEGDIYLLFSDGIMDFVDEEAMAKICAEGGGTEEMSEKFVRMAMKNGTDDNVTALCVKTGRAAGTRGNLREARKTVTLEAGRGQEKALKSIFGEMPPRIAVKTGARTVYAIKYFAPLLVLIIAAYLFVNYLLFPKEFRTVELELPASLERKCIKESKCLKLNWTPVSAGRKPFKKLYIIKVKSGDRIIDVYEIAGADEKVSMTLAGNSGDYFRNRYVLVGALPPDIYDEKYKGKTVSLSIKEQEKVKIGVKMECVSWCKSGYLVDLRLSFKGSEAKIENIRLPEIAGEKKEPKFAESPVYFLNGERYIYGILYQREKQPFNLGIFVFRKGVAKYPLLPFWSEAGKYSGSIILEAVK